MLTGVILTAIPSWYASRPRAGEHALFYDGDDYVSIKHNSTFDDIESRDSLTLEARICIASFAQGWFSIVDKHERRVDFGWTMKIFSPTSPSQPTSRTRTASRFTSVGIRAEATSTRTGWSTHFESGIAR
jgi:hypothetical protein